MNDVLSPVLLSIAGALLCCAPLHRIRSGVVVTANTVRYTMRA